MSLRRPSSPQPVAVLVPVTGDRLRRLNAGRCARLLAIVQRIGRFPELASISSRSAISSCNGSIDHTASPCRHAGRRVPRTGTGIVAIREVAHLHVGNSSEVAGALTARTGSRGKTTIRSIDRSQTSVVSNCKIIGAPPAGHGGGTTGHNRFEPGGRKPLFRKGKAAARQQTREDRQPASAGSSPPSDTANRGASRP